MPYRRPDIRRPTRTRKDRYRETIRLLQPVSGCGNHCSDRHSRDSESHHRDRTRPTEGLRGCQEDRGSGPWPCCRLGGRIRDHPRSPCEPLLSSGTARYRLGRRHSVLEEAINRCCEMLGPELRSRVIKVEKPPTDETRIRIDPGELDAVILNLMTNSIYWMLRRKSGRRLRFRVSPGPTVGRVTVSVDDTGPGIDLRDRERVFRPGWTRNRAESGWDWWLRQKWWKTGAARCGPAFRATWVERHSSSTCPLRTATWEEVTRDGWSAGTRDRRRRIGANGADK